MAQQLRTFFKKYARGRGVQMADALAKEMRRLVSVQAPTRTTRTGKVVATTKAKPFKPPRRVSGKLQNSIKVHRTAHGAKLVIYAPYAVRLETSRRFWGWPHAFVVVAMRKLGIKNFRV